MKIREIVNLEKIVPDAYHGTSRENAKNICTEGFRLGTSDKNYLGDGVYFFEGSEKNAIDWGRDHFNGAVISVIKSNVSLGNCLDLHNQKHRKLIKTVAEQLKKRGKIATDPVVINFIATNFEPTIDTVRATHISPSKKKKIFKGSRFYDNVRLIISIRNLKNILNLSIIYEGR